MDNILSHINKIFYKDSKVKFIKTALIVGAGHGIGLGFVQKLLENEELEILYATYRKTDKAEVLSIKDPRLQLIQFDPSNEEEYKSLTQSIARDLDLCINCIGTLHTESLKPEKSLKDINLSSLAEYFKINSSITPMLAKHLRLKLRGKNQSIFATLSAKVGSISDNDLGGWYGYRASKAALNMFLKNIDIEFRRGKFNCLIRSLHPGTTITELSKPFIANTKYRLHTPYECASNLLVILDKTREEEHLFYSWDGERLEW
jgi:NAD(P)-dependent dehydrogenase (short-subunit alcohol dehydrogenase family)